MKYLVIGNLDGCRVYLCDCPHQERCEPFCITASEMIARRFPSVLEAIDAELRVGGAHPNISWFVALDEPMTEKETVLLGVGGRR